MVAAVQVATPPAHATHALLSKKKPGLHVAASAAVPVTQVKTLSRFAQTVHVSPTNVAVDTQVLSVVASHVKAKTPPLGHMVQVFLLSAVPS